jgi:cytochrome c2
LNLRLIAQVLIHALAAALLIVLPALVSGRPLMRPPAMPILLTVGSFAAAYFACSMILLATEARGSRTTILRILVGGMAAIGGALLFLTIAQWQMPSRIAGESPLVPVASSVFVLALLLALFAVRGATAAKLLVLAAAVALGAVAQVRMPGGRYERERVVSYLDSSLYSLKSTAYRRWIDDGGSHGGSIAAFRDGYVVADGNGALYFVRETGGQALDVRRLAYRVPVNLPEFLRDAQRILGDRWRSRGRDDWFNLRVADLLVQSRPDGSFRMFASHHFWKTRESCAVVRVSVLEGKNDELTATDHLQWRTLYETSPCLGLSTEGRGLAFGALQIGGAMGLVGDGGLLLAVGDHEYDGWNQRPALPQDPDSPYGKIMLIDTGTGKGEIYSLGHRYPQGLFVAASGEVWETEHGPRGGDELNHVRRGANYGWPVVTYGTEYGMHEWPFNPSAGRHDGFERPTLAFVPSLALSGLTGIAGPRFAEWRGDLVLASLHGQLRRVRVEEGRVVVDEPLAIGYRNRDIAQGADGRIAIWTDQNDLIFLEPAGTADGEALVFQCMGCHTVQEWGMGTIGPSLYRVFGRRVAAEEGFDYSPAMRDFGGRWSRERLDRFLADPAGTVPGTSMQFPGIPDAARRGQLIDYLEKRGQR